MDQKRLAIHLKVCIVLAFLGSILLYGFLLPNWGRVDYGMSLNDGKNYRLWLFFLWGTAIPLLGVVICSWRIASAIGKGNSFSRTNAVLLKMISYLAAGDTVYFLVGNFVLMILGLNDFGILIKGFFLMLLGIFASVASAALSHLVHKAAALQEENDLTV